MDMIYLAAILIIPLLGLSYVLVRFIVSVEAMISKYTVSCDVALNIMASTIEKMNEGQAATIQELIVALKSKDVPEMVEAFERLHELENDVSPKPVANPKQTISLNTPPALTKENVAETFQREGL